MEKHKGKWKWEADTFDARLEQFTYGYAAITNMDGVEKLWADLHTTLCGSGFVEHPVDVY